MTPTFDPKKRFQSDKATRDVHAEVVVSTRFNAAAEAALLHLIANIPEAKTQEEAAARWRQVEGARAFLASFMNLAEGTPAPPLRPPQNLNFKAQ